MEYTDCDNCQYLEAENADLLAQNEELEQENTSLRDTLDRIARILEDLE